MIKKIFLLLAFSPTLWGQEKAPSYGAVSPVLQGTWIQNRLKWEKAPRQIQPRPETAPAAVLYFYPDHKFAFFYGLVLRYGKETPGVSAGDGLTIYRGTWDRVGDGIKVRYRLEERTISKEGEKIPGECTNGLIQFRNNGLLFQGIQFKGEPGMDQDVLRVVLGSGPSPAVISCGN
jgi:hypothetical protein